MLESMADLRGKRLGKCTLIERIGRGGMSNVYRAKADDADEEVAVKVLTLDPEQEESDVFLARFEREIGIIAKLRHEHILPILDYGRDDEFAYFVMPLISGGTLADVIRRGPLDVNAASHWLTQIASALDHAHQSQVIHRDLKPSNVLLDEDGNAYLTDFGIAKLANFTSGLTQTGNVIGTPAYMAPEQWRDEKLDPRADVYGLAIMTYLMLTTHTPFEAETAHGMMYQHLDQIPPSMRVFNAAIPEQVDRVVLRALAKAREERFASAGEFAAVFREAVEYGVMPPPIVGVPPSLPQSTTSMHDLTPEEVPPPIYGPYRPTYYPIPEHLLREKAREPTRWWIFLVSIGLVTVVTVAFLSLIIVGGMLLEAARSGSNEAAPPSMTPSPVVTPNERPLDVPRIRVDFPVEEITVSLGESVIIQASAFDNQGVTRVELRRFGIALSEVRSNQPNGESPFAVQLVYTPDSTGIHRLELVAFRGDLEGEPRFITIQVR